MSTDGTASAKLVAFSEDTSLHGLKNVGGSSGKIIRRILWLVVMLCMLSLLLFYFIKGLIRYLDHPTVTKITEFENNSLLFPIVTICNNNMIRASYIEDHPLVGNVTGLDAPYLILYPTMDLTQASAIRDMKDIKYKDIMFEGRHRVEDLFEYCSWNGIPFNCSEEFIPTFTMWHGVCYSFNTNRSMVTKVPSNFYGLEVIVNTEHYQYSHMAISPGAGIRVIIHEVKFAPLESSTVLLPTGVASEMTLFRKQHISLPYPYEGPGCYEGDEYKSLTDCQNLCLNEYLASQCQCQIVPMTDVSNDYNYCSLFDYHNCIMPEDREFVQDASIEKACPCLHHCQEVSFDVRHSHMVFPSYVAVENDYMKYNDTEYDYRNNMVHLKIYYGNLVTTVIEQVGAYTFANFSAEVGGYMGLCLGASLLTLTELMEFVMTLSKALCRRRKKVTVKEDSEMES